MFCLNARAKTIACTCRKERVNIGIRRNHIEWTFNKAMPKVNVKDKRKQQLIEANLASIARRGLTETTIAHVSQGADMSRGIVNFYFTSKERMMQDTLKYLAAEFETAWQEALAQAKEKSPQAQLAILVRAAFNAATCNQKRLAAWAAFWGHAFAHPEYRKILTATDGAYPAGLEERAPKNAPADFARQLHAMIKGAWLAFLLSPAADKKALEAMCLAFAEGKSVPAAGEKKPAPKIVASSNQPRKKPEEKLKEVQLGFDDLFAAAKN